MIKEPSEKRPVVFELDFSSSDRFYAVLLEQVFSNLRRRRGVRLSRMDDARQLEIISMHASGRTLDEIGKQFGVTRERIRQIERKVWSQIALFRSQLKGIETLLSSLLRKCGSFERTEHLKELMAAKYGWTERQIDYLLNHYLTVLTDKFEFVGDDYITLTDYRCWKCEHFRERVKEEIEKLEERNGSLTLDEFSKQIRASLDASPKCAECRAKHTAVSPELFVWLFKKDPTFQKSQDKMTVRRSSQFPGLNRSVLLVLKIAGRPLSKREILAELKKMFPKKTFTLKQIQSTTSNSPQCFDEIFLWDRGGIHSETLYIHKDYIQTDAPIFDEIEQQLMAESEKGAVPQIRLNRLYNLHAEPLAKAGIPNVYALFSTLKVRACPNFTFQRSPYIGFAGNRQKISNAKILEEFVLKKGEPVSRQDMRAFGRSLGLQDEHISNTIVLTNLLATQNGYVIRNDFPSEGPEFQALLEHINKALAKKSSVSVCDVFKNEKALCDKLGIVDAKMLYSLLRRFANLNLEMKYPQILLKGKRKPRGRRKSGTKKADKKST